MTEYDFSPEAYQRYLDSMARISRWVGHTEQHRPEFEDASALMDRHSRRRPASPPPNKLKKRPQPLPLPPLGAPSQMHYPYPYPPNVPHSVRSDFDYGMGMAMSPGMDYISPGGPMYAPMSAPIPPPGAMYPQLIISPQHSHRSRSRSSRSRRRRSHSRSSSISYAVPPVVSAPPGYNPYMQASGPSPVGYGPPPPGYLMVPPPMGRYHPGGPSFVYI